MKKKSVSGDDLACPTLPNSVRIIITTKVTLKKIIKLKEGKKAFIIFNLSWEPCLCKLPNFLNLPFVFMEKNQVCLCSQGQFTPPLYKSDSRPEKLALSTAHKENVRVLAHSSREIQKFQKKSPNSFLIFVRVIKTYIIKQLYRHLF